MCESIDPALLIMALSMRLKYEKYWGDLSKINILLYIAITVDSRYKIDEIVYGLISRKG